MKMLVSVIIAFLMFVAGPSYVSAQTRISFEQVVAGAEISILLEGEQSAAAHYVAYGIRDPYGNPIDGSLAIQSFNVSYDGERTTYGVSFFGTGFPNLFSYLSNYWSLWWSFNSDLRYFAPNPRTYVENFRSATFNSASLAQTYSDAAGVFTVTPEPSTWSMIGLGLLLTGWVVRRRMLRNT